MKKVRLSVVEDNAYLGGHALIRFPQDLGASGHLRLAITRRSPDTPHLGRSGWQASPAFVDVEVIGSGSGATTVRVGPDVCEEIRENVQITIEAVDHEVGGECFWPHVTARMSRDKPPPEGPEKPEGPEPSPQPPPPSVPRKKGHPLFYLLPLILIAIGGGLYAMRDRVPWDGLLGESLAAKLERLEQSDTDGDELLALSIEADDARDSAISLQALRLAFERGNVGAKLGLARLYDPRFADPGKLGPPEAPNSNLAARYYFEMCVADHTGAAELLDSLCEESRKAGSPHSSQFRGFLANTYCEGSCRQ